MILARHLLLGPLAALAACATPSLDAALRYGQFSLGGDVLTTSGATVQANSFDSLGLNDDEETVAAAVDLKWGSPHLSISTQSTGFTGRGVLVSQIEVGNDTISVGSTVDSDIDVGVHSALLTWDLAPSATAEFGLGFGLVGLELDLRFREVSPGSASVSSDETVPIPVVAARAGLSTGNLELAGSFSGLDITVDDSSVTFFDLDVYGRYRFGGGRDHASASLVLGYRSTDFEVDYTDAGDRVNANLEIDGPYIGVHFSF